MRCLCGLDSTPDFSIHLAGVKPIKTVGADDKVLYVLGYRERENETIPHRDEFGTNRSIGHIIEPNNVVRRVAASA
jgi:hypothetical protein